MRSIQFLFATASMALWPRASVAQSFPKAPEVRVTFSASKLRDIHVAGIADRSTGRAVSVDDPVRIASVSKFFVALGVLRLVDQRKIDLDRDVSDYLGWRLRNPAFPDAKITLRLLLSHQSSVSDDADYVIPLDQTIRTKLSDPKAWDATHAPGIGWFHYTNLNFPVIASVLEAATGERFDRLMARTVMKPLRLQACYNWSQCAPDRAARAVVLYRAGGDVARDDLKGVPPPCPGVPSADGSCDLDAYKLGWNGAFFSPQGGLRISARDLARTGQMLLGRGKGFLSRASFAQLTKPLWRFDGGNGATENGFYCAYGLATQFLATTKTGCRDDVFGDGVQRFGHAGEAYGLKSGLWVDPVSGTGVAYFTTAVPDDAPRGESAFYQVEEALVRGPHRSGHN
jgi:CubicO group peptidase (beta-lactamase class C family)